MATPTLPLDSDGKLVPFDSSAITALGIKRRGVRDGDHVQYNFGPDGSGCTRKFSCNWDERFNAQIYFAGAAVQWLDSGNPKISRLVPVKDPDFANWICTKANITGYQYSGEIETPAAGSEALPIFERAELECTFEMVPFDVLSDGSTEEETDRYVTWPGYPGAEVTTETSYITMPGSVMIYTSDNGTDQPANVPIPYGIGYPESLSTFRVIWRRVPFEAWGPTTLLTHRVIGTEGTRGYLGAVNKTTFHGYPASHLQLRGVEARLLPDATGLGYAWDIAYIMSEKPVPFGHLGYIFFETRTTGDTAESGYYQVQTRSAGAARKEIDDVGDGDSLFHVREFADLFVVGSV